ncbi:MAG TPA: hypothetical protein DDW76_11635 [Cyanobacteria bacterium UBA11369]|nr:hypothetical protein [Cyanobacteria bacterium UBA11371]HBE32864.1 hypothetical protein [Cyanobacteria bacterium UBA11368]HBE49422.1 hypothetical protein [Cyanobacteria bacterium UBA11369]
MSENNQPFDRYEENAGSAEPSVDAAAENIDPLTDQSDVGKAGTCRRVANAALVGAGVGAVAGAFAAALTGKGVADGVKAIVDGAVDTVKEAAENVKSTIIEGAENTVKGVAYGVNSTVEEGDVYQVSNPLEVEATRPVAPGNKGDETNNVANNATSSDALLQMLLNQVGTELARSFYEQLPAVVLAEIQRLATNPTLEEKQWITDRWAKALEPLAMAMIVSAQSYKTGTPLTETNGYHKQVNHQETPI